ncbi:MAG: lipid-transfer protein [Pseudomonadales bacterium]|nr:lipid-transfer protein [Pseudomonadales bacterium]
MNRIRETAIVGIGQTEFSKNSGRSELQLAAEASLAAIRDAGLEPADIDGMVTFTQDMNDELALMRCLGVEDLSWTARTPFGGGGASATVELAAAAVASGAARHVLVYRAFNERSGNRFGQPGDAAAYQRMTAGPDFHFTYGLDTPAKIYALWYQRYMRKYNVSSEDLGRYVVVARKHAATNPAAWFHGRPITLADHQASRWIVEPTLRLLDCCQESDGGVALVVSSAERAKDLRQPLVRVRAATQAQLRNGDIMFDYYHEHDLAQFAEARRMSERLWAQSGLAPTDIDVAMIYENFSPVVFLALEAHGFCGPGEAKDFIRDGHIELDGSLPLNTHGGLLGEGYIHGVNNILEGVRQLRGTAANQVRDAQHVLVSAARSGMILSRD